MFRSALVFSRTSFESKAGSKEPIMAFSTFSNRGSAKGHSRNSSFSSLATVKTSREKTLDHDIYLLADRKGTFANEDKLSRLRNCIHYIYRVNVIVKLLARPSQSKRSAKTSEGGDETFSHHSLSRRNSIVPTTVDEIIAIERMGTVPTSKILYYA